MQSRSFGYAIFAILALVLASPVPASADKCTSLKLKAIAKREAGLLACSAKVAKLGDPSIEAACIDKVTAKFTELFAKAGDCIGVASNCETNIDDFCVPAVLALLPDAGPSNCEAARLKASGKHASSSVRCFAKKPEVQAACQTKAEEKFATAFDKVSGCGGDGQQSTVAASIDANCVDTIVTTDGSGIVTELCAPVCVTPPTGSYSATCSSCTACGNVLSCRCPNSFTNPSSCPGSCNPTSLPLPCAGDIANCNGVLRCGGC